MRLLKANEIEVRIGMCKEKGASLLLYKNARVDMQILDETFGDMNWKREHKVVSGNNYCAVSVYNDKINEWISKEDCGTESNTEKQKGEASDSFKRACVNWGIGRELYTSPFIWITNVNVTGSNNKFKTFDKFKVQEITYDENREVENLIILNQKNEQVFVKIVPLAKNYLQNLQITAKEKGYEADKVKELMFSNYAKTSSKHLTTEQAKELVKFMKDNPKNKEEKVEK